MNEVHNSSISTGRALHFPVNVDSVTGKIEEISYEESIRESIYLIVMTKKGERIMRPDFGCDIHQYMFEPVNSTMLTLVRCAVEEALTRWEPRIEDIEVEPLTSLEEENELKLVIHYRIKATRAMAQTIVPFHSMK